MDEVPARRDQKVQFVFERNRITLRPADVLTRRGQELGSAGRFEEALASFREAGQADPFDPQARYEEGFTLLHLRRYAEAVEAYEATARLAPGWFHCRADLWLARELAAGDLAHEALLAVWVLEDGPQPLGTAEQVAILEQGSSVQGVTFAPDSATLAVAEGTSAGLHSVPGGKKLCEFSDHEGQVGGVAFRPVEPACFRAARTERCGSRTSRRGSCWPRSAGGSAKSTRWRSPPTACWRRPAGRPTWSPGMWTSGESSRGPRRGASG
jgi:hypothetical protein